MLGNALFFMLSSFGLFLSGKWNETNFAQWYGRRILKIYPSVWVTIFLLYIPVNLFFTNKISIDTFNILESACILFYPPYWFLQALLIFYCIGFFLISAYSYKKIISTFLILLLLYIYYYFNYLDLSIFRIENEPFVYIKDLLTFIFGIFLAKNNKKINYSGPTDFLILFSSIILIYFHKYLMVKNLFCQFQIFQHLILFVFLYYSVKISRSPIIQCKLMQSKAGSVIKSISNITLEIYIVHSTISSTILHFNYTFPINLLIFLTATLFLSVFVKFVADKLICEKLLYSVNKPQQRL